MKCFYTILRVFCVFVDFCIVCIFAIILLFGGDSITAIILLLISIPIIVIIESILFIYYKNIVIEVRPNGKYMEITTNKTIYHMPKSDILEIKEVSSEARTYIICNNAEFPKRLIYQMRYSPFRCYHLDYEMLKKELPHTTLIKM